MGEKVKQLPQEVMIEFIEIYRANPCLWQIKSQDYLNKAKRSEAHEQLIKVVKPHYPEVTKDYILKKINSLRTAFRRELKKINDSKRSGRGEEDVYRSSLWYFELLLFTTDQEIPRPSRSNLQKDKENMLVYEHYSDDDIIEYIDPAMEITESDSTGVTDPPLKKKRRLNKKKDEMLEKAFVTLNKEEDEFDAIGIVIAAKLRKLANSNDRQRIHAEFLINKTLAKAELGVLTENFDIR